MTTTTETKVTTRQKMQELAIVCGVTLKDGSPVVVGEPKCPPTIKIIEALKTLGWKVSRMSKAQRSDAYDDHGFTGRHVSNINKLSPAIISVMQSYSGVTDCDGDMTVEHYLLTHI